MHGLYPNDASIYDSAGRLLMVGFFMIGGLRNLSSYQIEDHVKRLALFKAPLPRVTFWIGMILNAAGCALLLINWHPMIGVLGLIVFTVVASLLLLRFWEMDAPLRQTGMQNGFLANIGVLGGLLLLLQNVM